MATITIHHRRNQWFVVALFLISFIPLAIAWLLIAFDWKPDSETAKGTFLSPPIYQSDLLSTEMAFPGENKWRLLVVEKQCDLECEGRLESYRKMHVALGRTSERLERILITSDSFVSHDPFLITAPSDLLTEARFNELSKGVWLMDPQGWLIMKFDSEQPASEMHHDILKLLKIEERG